ncbi:MAG: twin-arginine translocation signal domain-containing protein [Rhodospirillales bacterium]|nr:twin-arginine translocation signal domain-containing protein [Rhodospirillaceae bacterium]MBT7770133.1 twin-arginine translocation signal domain-containing protein [Rhodospirillales bacterium]MBT8002460.1 twin-arginine translocation signal domain-containing protein [Rhodospirillales bacterium]
MSIELSRREFLKIVFATASATAVSGASVLWPSNAIARPVFEPVYLSVHDGYIVDPYFDYCDVCLPTFRELHSLEGLEADALKAELEQISDYFEHVVVDPDNWTIDELEEWLDTQVDMEDMGAWKAMKYTQYGPALEIYEQLAHDDANELGLILVEGCHPGSDFVGIEFHGNLAELNRGFERLGMNLVVT